MVTEEQKRRYMEMRELAKQELDELDRQLASEIAQSKARIHEIQEARKAIKLIYDGASSRLGEKDEVKTQSSEISEIEKHA